MTGGRFAVDGLATRAINLADSIEVPLASPPRVFSPPDHTSPTAFLLTLEDLLLGTGRSDRYRKRPLYFPLHPVASATGLPMSFR